jgi:hypothetical protein
MRRAAMPWFAAALLAALVAAVAALFWPGVAMFDTVAQYRQVLGGPVDDWHPPAMVRLWQLLHPLGGGTAPMFALQIALYACGFGLVAAALARGGRWVAGLAALVLAVSPLLLGWQMVVLKDTQMLGALLAAVGIVAVYRLAGRNLPLVGAAAVVILVAYATLVRVNAVFATIPLAVLLLPTRGRPVLSLFFGFAAGAAILALAPPINHRLLGAEPSDVAKSQPLFDLAAIAVRTPPTAASPFTPAERAQLAGDHCVSAFFWDPLTDQPDCADATARVLDRPAGELYRELALAAAAHPLAYASHRFAHWNSTERWLVAPGLAEAAPPDEAEPNDLGLAGPHSAAATAWQDLAAIEAGTPLGWPIMWTVVALLLAPVAWRRRSEPAGGIALALVASALTLEASFLVVSIASDLRYHLWPMAASALAAILLGDRIAPTRRCAFAAGILFALVAGGGLIARAALPQAPGTYAEMVKAPSG